LNKNFTIRLKLKTTRSDGVGLYIVHKPRISPGRITFTSFESCIQWIVTAPNVMLSVAILCSLKLVFVVFPCRLISHILTGHAGAAIK
jgi:hypothetical protein